MGQQTRYKRDTWKKNQLRDSMNTPRYGTNACHLCERGRIPDDLTVKVTKYKTCGDIHLELSLLGPDQSSCATGQETYRELCCPTTKSFQFPQMPKPNKPFLSVAAGLFLFWLYTRRIRRRVNAAPDTEGDQDQAKASKYQRMKDDQSHGSGSRKKGKSPVRSRSKSRERGMQRPRSKDSKESSAKKKQQQQREPPMVVKTFKTKKETTTNVSNVLQQQQRRIQQQFHKSNGKNHDDEYYRFEDDTMYNDSTMGGHDTIAGESMDAVITQVV